MRVRASSDLCYFGMWRRWFCSAVIDGRFLDPRQHFESASLQYRVIGRYRATNSQDSLLWLDNPLKRLEWLTSSTKQASFSAPAFIVHPRQTRSRLYPRRRFSTSRRWMWWVGFGRETSEARDVRDMLFRYGVRADWLKSDDWTWNVLWLQYFSLCFLLLFSPLVSFPFPTRRKLGSCFLAYSFQPPDWSEFF